MKFIDLRQDGVLQNFSLRKMAVDSYNYKKNIEQFFLGKMYFGLRKLDKFEKNSRLFEISNSIF